MSLKTMSSVVIQNDPGVVRLRDIRLRSRCNKSRNRYRNFTRFLNYDLKIFTAILLNSWILSVHCFFNTLFKCFTCRSRISNVTVHIETPRGLSREQKEALRKFSETLKEHNYKERKSWFDKFKK